jgi:large subunit ribosomal protein L10
MRGQLAVVTGAQDIAATAKILKTFESEFDKPKIQFGYMGDQRLENEELKQIADLPPLEVLRAKLMGVINAPAQKLATLINTPGTQLAQVIKAKAEKGE